MEAGWGWGDGKELVKPGLFLVCSEANCWENPMTLKPSLSLLTEKNRSQNKAPSGNIPDSRDKQPVGLGYSLAGSCRAEVAVLRCQPPPIPEGQDRGQQEEPRGQLQV